MWLHRVLVHTTPVGAEHVSWCGQRCYSCMWGGRGAGNATVCPAMRGSCGWDQDMRQVVCLLRGSRPSMCILFSYLFLSQTAAA